MQDMKTTRQKLITYKFVHLMAKFCAQLKFTICSLSYVSCIISFCVKKCQLTLLFIINVLILQPLSISDSSLMIQIVQSVILLLIVSITTTILCVKNRRYSVLVPVTLIRGN